MTQRESARYAGRDWVANPHLFFEMCKNKARRQEAHDQVLVKLVEYIYRELSKTVNYDHVSSTVTKTDLPLNLNGKRYDISFLLNGRVFFVQLDSRAVARNAEGGTGEDGES